MSTLRVELEDSRRLTGPNLLADVPGAVIDGRVGDESVHALREAWRRHARDVLDAVGWAEEVTADRTYAGGVTLFVSAPIDALYAATEVNEWAWAAAAAEVSGEAPPEPLNAAAGRLRELIADERSPALLALEKEASQRGVSFLSDDDYVSVGTGSGSRSWPVDRLPSPDTVAWEEIHDVPRVLVTGTNGKTTTVRMLATIVEASGHTPGFTCTDGIYVGGELVDSGDWSGPGGARQALRDSRVEVAILETARGGMLRRGLAVDRVDGALVANVAADHLGEWGVMSVEDVARAKLVLAKAVRHGAPLVVNADDPVLSGVARALGRPITWIAREQVERVRSESGPADTAWIADGGWLCRSTGGEVERLVEVEAVPATLGGAAQYNVSNALGAAALAHALGLSDDVIRSGLTAFDSSPDVSPGRGNLFDLGGVSVLVDYVHNAHGFAAIADTVNRMAPKRVGLMIGQAGDRDDDGIREMVREACRMRPARIAVKEMLKYLRGREAGVIPAIILEELAALSVPKEVISEHDSELDAARALLEWSNSGDLLLFSSQADREGLLELVEGLSSSGWAPGGPVP